MPRRGIAAVALAGAALLAPCASAQHEPLRGVSVRRVYPGGRGEIAGLRVGDVITGCDGKAIRYPFELRSIFKESASSKLTVKARIRRDGQQMEIDIVPGRPDFYVERFFRGYDAFLRGPNADVRWNDYVEAGYDAFCRGSFGEAAGFFEKASAAGLEGNRDVLKDTARALISSLQGNRSYSYARAAFDLDETDRDSARVLYYSCLMSGRFAEAAKLLAKLPRHAGPASFVFKREREEELMRRAAEAKKTLPAAGQDANRLADPLSGKETRKTLFKSNRGKIVWGRMQDFFGSVRFRGGKPLLDDFVFSVEIRADEYAWDDESRILLVQVNDEDGNNLFGVGVDDRGNLLLGHSWCEAVAPCETATPLPKWNTVKMVREGARIDGYLNDKYVASTFVPKTMKAKLFFACWNGEFRYRKVTLYVPGDPIDEDVF